MGLWKGLSTWLAANKNALQGAVALLVLLGLLVSAIKWVKSSSKPDLVARVEVDNDTTPNDLIEWANWAWFNRLEHSTPKATGQSVPLSEYFYPHPASSIEKRFALPNDSGVLKISIFNQTDQNLDDVRLRTDDISQLWDVRMKGSYLQKPDIQNYLRQVTYPSSGSLVLPQLPPIPPGGHVNLALYGDISSLASVEVSVPNHTSQTVRIVKMPDTWLINLYQNPAQLWAWFSLALIMATIVFPFVGYAVRQRIIKRAVPGIFYDAACSEAVENRPDSAMLLLEKAFLAGYTNKAHARADSDLQCLHGRDDFEALVRQ